MFSNVPSWQHTAHAQGWQKTSSESNHQCHSLWGTSAGKRVFSLLHITREKGLQTNKPSIHLNKQTNKSEHKYVDLKWMVNLTNLVLGLLHQPFLGFLPTQQLGAGKQRFDMYTYSRRAEGKHIPEGHSPVISSQLCKWPRVIFEAYKSLIPLMAPSTSTGIPQGFLLSLGPTKQGCCYESVWNHCLSSTRK